MEQAAVEMLAEVNRVRASGCACGNAWAQAVGPLALEVRLQRAAQAHAENMAWRDVLDHVGANGTSAFDRMRAVGYTFRAAAENIASGNLDVEATARQLLGSSGHCQNMMSPLHVHLGVGYARARSGQHYWVLDFAAPW